MSIVAGKYEFVKQENGKEFYQGIGGSDELAKKTETTKVTLEVIVDGDKIQLNSHYNDKVNKLEVVQGKTFTEPMPNGWILDSVASIEGNKIVIKSSKDGNHLGGRVYEFNGSELIVSINANATPVVCKRTYKKL